MKLKACSLFVALFLAIGSTAFSADIPVTGPDVVYGTGQFTFYATPVVSGATYTWDTSDATVVSQNTDPAAGPIYITFTFPPILAEGYIEITDNQGNSGSHYFQIWGWGLSVLQNPFDASYSL